MRSAKPGNHLNSLSLILIIILIMMMTIMVMIVISCFYRRITTTTQFPPSSARIKMEDLDVDLFKLLVTVGFVFLTWVSQITVHAPKFTAGQISVENQDWTAARRALLSKTKSCLI